MRKVAVLIVALLSVITMKPEVIFEAQLDNILVFSRY